MTDTQTDAPAVIRHVTLHGRRGAKYTALSELELDSKSWRPARTDWQAPLTPAAESAWDEYPALNDLLPWALAGVKPNRTWVYSPDSHVLKARWSTLVSESDPKRRKELFKESRDATLTKTKAPLTGADTVKFTGSFESDKSAPPDPVKVGFRSFDRQWIIPDSRLLHGPSPDLWSARIPDQLFVVEQHAHPIDNGPAVVFSALITDMHHFNNRGGHNLPLLHPDGSPNLAAGIVEAVGNAHQGTASAKDLISYIAAVVAHPAFTQRFADELTTPGVRVPITGDPVLWSEAVALGRKVVWLHTYGEAFTNEEGGRPTDNVRFPNGDDHQPLSLKPVTKMPEEMAYDANTMTLRLGDGEWGPVRPAVIEYEVGGRNVLKSWFNYRKRNPTGRKSSPLDEIHLEEWPNEWTVELINLLTVLTRLVELEPAQADLLDRILAGPILTKDELAEKGVEWPTTKKDHAPRRAGMGGGTAQQPTLDDQLE